METPELTENGANRIIQLMSDTWKILRRKTLAIFTLTPINCRLFARQKSTFGQRINLVFLEKNVSESHDNRNDGRPTLLQWLRATLVLNIGDK